MVLVRMTRTPMKDRRKLTTWEQEQPKEGDM